MSCNISEKFREMRANQQSRDVNLALVLISTVLMFLCCHTPRYSARPANRISSQLQNIFSNFPSLSNILLLNKSSTVFKVERGRGRLYWTALIHLSLQADHIHLRGRQHPLHSPLQRQEERQDAAVVHVHHGYCSVPHGKQTQPTASSLCSTICRLPMHPLIYQSTSLREKLLGRILGS